MSILDEIYKDEPDKVEWFLLMPQQRWQVSSRMREFAMNNGGIMLADWWELDDIVLQEPPIEVQEAEFCGREGKLFHREGWEVRWKWFYTPNLNMQHSPCLAP